MEEMGRGPRRSKKVGDQSIMAKSQIKSDKIERLSVKYVLPDLNLSWLGLR